jgi:excisionase family DNA binding protein
MISNACVATTRKKRRDLNEPGMDTAGRPTSTDSGFTIDDLVVYLKLPKSTVYKLSQEGKIPGLKVGRHWRFHKDRIDAWLMGASNPQVKGIG